MYNFYVIEVSHNDDFSSLKYPLSIAYIAYKLGQNCEKKWHKITIFWQYQCNNKICGIYVQSLDKYFLAFYTHPSQLQKQRKGQK